MLDLEFHTACDSASREQLDTSIIHTDTFMSQAAKGFQNQLNLEDRIVKTSLVQEYCKQFCKFFTEGIFELEMSITDDSKTLNAEKGFSSAVLYGDYLLYCRV